MASEKGSGVMAHCVISAIFDSEDGMVPACVVHTTYAPCPHDGEPANPGPLHMFNHESRDAGVEFWRLRTHGQRPLVIHDEQRMPDLAGHVIEDEILPCPCGAEVLKAVEEA
jgi:hypothetical protein